MLIASVQLYVQLGDVAGDRMQAHSGVSVGGRMSRVHPRWATRRRLSPVPCAAGDDRASVSTKGTTTTGNAARKRANERSHPRLERYITTAVVGSSGLGGPLQAPPSVGVLLDFRADEHARILSEISERLDRLEGRVRAFER